jgi:hypothetical protein
VDSLSGICRRGLRRGGITNTEQILLFTWEMLIDHGQQTLFFTQSKKDNKIVSKNNENKKSPHYFGYVKKKSNCE